jgi:DNA-binding transcriptional MerR regulator
MKIAEVSEQYAISSDTLRYDERIGLIPLVNRNGSGIRDYNETDVKRVEFIKCMRCSLSILDWFSRAIRRLKQEKKS